MRLFFRSRRGWHAVLGALALGIAAGLGSGSLVSWPVVIGSGSSPFPIGNVLGVIVATLAAWSLSQGERATDRMALRPIGCLEACLVLGIGATSLLGFYAGSAWDASATYWFARNSALSSDLFSFRQHWAGPPSAARLLRRPSS